MPNSNRERGDYLERTTKAALAAHDWWVVRAAGSLGAADIVALRAHSAPLLIACKTNGKLPRAEREQLIEAAHRAGARPIMATRTRRGWIDFLLVGPDGGRPFGDPVKVPKRGSAQVDDGEGGDDADE
jgi:Holliday junction resolvase